MPVAKTLLEYLADPATELPQPRAAEEVVQEIQRLLDQPERGGGATYSLYFGDQFGEPFFAVALDNRLTQRLPDPDDLSQAVADFLALHRNLLRHPRCSVGIWTGVNPDGIRMLFLDVTVLVYNETIALTLAAESNQIAIFDLQRGVEVDTGGTGLPTSGTLSPQERLKQLAGQDNVIIAKASDYDDTDKG
jgi:hypothetical protein